MSTRRRMLSWPCVQCLLLYVCYAAAAATSLPPENKPMGVHQLHMKTTHPIPSVPIEEVHNSLLDSLGGREVDPRPSIPVFSQESILTSTAAPESPKHQASSVKKQLVDKLTLSPDKVADYLTPDQAIDKADEEQHELLKNKIIESLNFNGSEASDHVNQSSIVARKGVSDPVPRVVPRKGVDFSTSEGALNPVDPLIMKPAEVDTVSNVATDAPSSTTTFFSFSQFNDIPKPPVKQATTEKGAPVYEPTPVSLASSTTPSSITKSTPHASKVHVKHYKPSAAVDSVSNKSFNSTPVIIGVVFGVVVILAVAILAYKKLQDVWSRRHYDRMDFLIDGMYDL